MLTTESCLLNPNRNPDLDREAIEQRLVDYLGVERTIWLRAGIAGDDTDGHVDDVARFVDPNTVVAAIEEDPTDINYQPLAENRAVLRSARNLDGKSLKIVELPMPPAVTFQGERLPASGRPVAVLLHGGGLKEPLAMEGRVAWRRAESRLGELAGVEFVSTSAATARTLAKWLGRLKGA